MTNREVFVTALAMLGAGFDRKLTAPAIELYWLALGDLTEDEMKQSVARAALECRFMPAPSELRAFVKPKADPATAAVLAWQAVRKAIDKYDWNIGSIDFGSLVNAVVRNLGGWDTLCKATLLELDNPGWLRKRFEEVYGLLASTNSESLNGEPLGGALPPLYVGAKHVAVSIDGQPVAKRIEAKGANDARASIQVHIRNLADEKAAE